jgi:hypothetical protein
MSFLSRPDTFRRTVTGTALLLGPVLFAAAEMTFPEPSESAANQVAQFAAHRTEQLTAGMLSVFTTMVLLPALLGTVHLVRSRGVALAHISALMIGYGLIAAHAALGGVNLIWGMLGSRGLDQAAMADLYDRVTHNVAVGAPLLLGHWAFVLGIILLGVALWRAGVGPRWAAVCIVLFPVSDMLLSVVPIHELAEWVSNGVGIAGMGALGLYVLRLTDDQWRSPSAEASAERTAAVSA